MQAKFISISLKHPPEIEAHHAWTRLFVGLFPLLNTPFRKHVLLTLFQKGACIAPPSEADLRAMAIDLSPLYPSQKPIDGEMVQEGYQRTNGKLSRFPLLNSLKKLFNWERPWAFNKKKIFVLPFTGEIFLKHFLRLNIIRTEDLASAPDANGELPANTMIYLSEAHSPTLGPEGLKFTSFFSTFKVNRKPLNTIIFFEHINGRIMPMTLMIPLNNRSLALNASGFVPGKASLEHLVVKVALLKQETNLDQIFPGEIPAISCDLDSLEKKLPPLQIKPKIYPRLGRQIYTSIKDKFNQAPHREGFETFKAVILSEMERSLCDLNSHKLAVQYQAIRNIMDLSIGAWTYLPSGQPSTLEITSQYFEHPPQLAHLTEFCMTGTNCVLVALLDCEAQFREKIEVISVKNTYFETQSIIGRLGRQVSRISHLEPCATLQELPLSADIIVIEPHPNNPSLEEKIEHHDFANWAKDWLHTRREKHPELPSPIFLIDATLNILGDEEMNACVNSIQTELEAGQAGLVIVQSNVKFATFGADIASGALAMAWLHEDSFDDFKSNFSDSLKRAPLPPHVARFYKYMIAETNELQQEYLEVIRKNTMFFSTSLLNFFANSRLPETRNLVVKIHPNLDRQTCYVSFDYNQLLDLGFEREQAKNIATAHLNWMLKVSERLNIPLTNKGSFGFPSANLSTIFAPNFTAIRLFIGIVNESELKKLAQVCVSGIELLQEYLSKSLTTAQIKAQYETDIELVIQESDLPFLDNCTLHFYNDDEMIWDPQGVGISIYSSKDLAYIECLHEDLIDDDKSYSIIKNQWGYKYNLKNWYDIFWIMRSLKQNNTIAIRNDEMVIQDARVERKPFEPSPEFPKTQCWGKFADDERLQTVFLPSHFAENTHLQIGVRRLKCQSLMFLDEGQWKRFSELDKETLDQLNKKIDTSEVILITPCTVHKQKYYQFQTRPFTKQEFEESSESRDYKQYNSDRFGFHL